MKLVIKFFTLLFFIFLPSASFAASCCVEQIWSSAGSSSYRCQENSTSDNCQSESFGGPGGASGVSRNLANSSCSEISDCPQYAGAKQETTNQPTQTDPNLAVPIPGLNLNPITCSPGKPCDPSWIGQYISALFTYGISLAVILSVVMIMIGGLVWLMSGGRQDQIGRAKEFITGALSGLLLALFSVIILQAINPGLVKLDPLGIVAPQAAIPSTPNAPTGTEDDITAEEFTNYVWENKLGFNPDVNTQNAPMDFDLGDGRVFDRDVVFTRDGHLIIASWPNMNQEDIEMFEEILDNFLSDDGVIDYTVSPNIDNPNEIIIFPWFSS